MTSTRLLPLLLATTLAGACAAKPATAAPAAPPPPAAAVPVAAAAQQPAATPALLTLPRPAGTEWFGLYVLGKKAGWATFELTEGTRDGQKTVIERSSVVLRAAVGGVQTERSISEERIYERKDQGRLLAFRVEHRGDGGDQTLVGTCTPKGIELRRSRPGVPDETRTLQPTAETVENADAPRLAAASGKPIEGASLDLEDSLEDKKSTTTIERKSTFTAAGVTVPVVVTRTVEEKNNMPLFTTIAGDGRVLEIKFGEVMVGKAEDEATAKQLDKVDLFALTRVVLKKPLPAALRAVPSQAIYRVSGLPKEYRVASARQQYTDAPDGSVRLTVAARAPKALKPRPIAASGDPAVADALRSTLSVEADAPAIVELAKTVVGEERDAYAAAKKLNRFVNGYLAKSYGSSSDRATDVLAAKRGDCTEHSLLLTALARASGIPARRVDGLVYMDAGDQVPAFYWHEWVEVFVGEWVAVDPTFNQDLADPTHLALGSEARSDTAGLIGQLKIELVEAKAK